MKKTTVVRYNFAGEQLFKLPAQRVISEIKPQKLRRDSIRTMCESDAKAIYKSLIGKTLKAKQGSHHTWLWSLGKLNKSFIQSSPEITQLFIKRGYDISTAYND